MWQVLPDGDKWRVWSVQRQVNVVRSVSYFVAFSIARNLEANAPKRAASLAAGL